MHTTNYLLTYPLDLLLLKVSTKQYSQDNVNIYYTNKVYLQHLETK
jgi:hypothetical protein